MRAITYEVKAKIKTPLLKVFQNAFIGNIAIGISSAKASKKVLNSSYEFGTVDSWVGGEIGGFYTHNIANGTYYDGSTIGDTFDSWANDKMSTALRYQIINHLLDYFTPNSIFKLFTHNRDMSDGLPFRKTSTTPYLVDPRPYNKLKKIGKDMFKDMYLEYAISHSVGVHRAKQKGFFDYSIGTGQFFESWDSWVI